MRIASSLLLLVGLGSCKKFVQISPPSTVIVSASVFDNDGAAHSALTAIYTTMFNANESWLVSYQTGLLGDELVNLDASATPFYENNLLPTTTVNLWNDAYNYIYQANAIIEGLSTQSGVTPAIAEQLIGEAKFIRAYWHFYLVNAYGDIPIVTNTNYIPNAKLSRSSTAEVYQQIALDLSSAIQMLNLGYVNQTDTTITTDRIRPCKAAATALLARLYLYSQKYDSAELHASTTISDVRYSLAPNPGDAFLANSSEAIWQLATTQPNYLQTGDGNGYVLLAGPGPLNPQLSAWLLNSFDSADLRRSNWISSYSDGTNTWYFPYKYQVYDDGNNPNNRTEYVMMLRLAEQYLIRAEARVQQNNLIGAAGDLNMIRQRAGLHAIADSIAADKDLLLTAILHERQVELFCEWGHRWFDLIRTANINSVMGSPGNICQQKGGTWNPDGHQALFPIQQTEINTDPNLSQNPGY